MGKAFALVFLLALLATGPLHASAGIVSSTTAVLAVGYKAYLGYSAISWTLSFADFLSKSPNVKDIPGWLWENKPTFLVDFLIMQAAIPKFMPEKQTETFRKYAKEIQCTDEDTVCNNVWKFMKMF